MSSTQVGQNLKPFFDKTIASPEKLSLNSA